MAETPHAKAKALIEAKDFAGAEALLSQVVTSQPADGLAWQLLGTVLHRKGDQAGSSIAYRRALELVPSDYVSAYGLAIVLKDLGQTDEAVSMLRRTIAIKPDFAPATKRLREWEATQPLPAQPIPPQPVPDRVKPSPSPEPVFAVAPPAGSYVGRARSIQKMKEENPWIMRTSTVIWDFRVEGKDASGSDLPPLAVRLVGRRIEGALVEGDWVALPGRWAPGTTATPKEMMNLTTGARIRVLRKSWVMPGILIAFLVLFLGFASWGVYSNFIADDTQLSPTADPQGGGKHQGGGGGGMNKTTTTETTTQPTTETTTAAPSPVALTCTNADGTLDIDINVGDAVQFENVGTESMTLDFSEPEPSTFSPQTLDPGATYDLLFPEAGSFSYSCAYSLTKQTGVVTVG